MSLRRVSLILVGSLLATAVMMSATTSAQAKTLVGVNCSKVGVKVGDGPGRTVVCKKIGKKTVWQLLIKRSSQVQQVPSKSTPSTTPTPTPTEAGGGSQQSSAPSAGAPCSQLNQQTATIPDAVLMGKTFTCIQSGKKLVWNNGEVTLWNGLTGATSVTCKGTSTKLTAGIVDPTKVAYFAPLGGMEGAHVTPTDHGHVYYPKDTAGNFHAPDGTWLVNSPADGSIISVGDFQSTNEYPYPDYRVIIAHSCNLFSVFIHVGKLIGPAADILNHLKGGQWEGNFPIKSGEVFSDDSANGGFDYALYDQTKKLTGLDTPSFAASPAELYVANFLDYLPVSLKPAYEAKFRSTTAPIGGKIDWNVAGTAQGDWFVENTNGFRGLNTANAVTYYQQCHVYTATHLAIAPDSIVRNAFIFSFGAWAGGCAHRFVSKDPTFDPSKITSASGTVVIELAEIGFVDAQGAPLASLDAKGAPVDRGYLPKGYQIVPGDTVQGLLAIRLNKDNSLTVEQFPGVTSKSSFTGFDAQAQTYVR